MSCQHLPESVMGTGSWVYVNGRDQKAGSRHQKQPGNLRGGLPPHNLNELLRRFGAGTLGWP